MPLNQQLKLQWSVPFLNGPVTVSVMMRTTPTEEPWYTTEDPMETTEEPMGDCAA